MHIQRFKFKLPIFNGKNCAGEMIDNKNHFHH